MNLTEALDEITCGDNSLRIAIADKINNSKVRIALVRLRARASMTVEELAARSGLSAKAINTIEHSMDDDLLEAAVLDYLKGIGKKFLEDDGWTM